MTITRNTAALDLDRAQQLLSRLLLAETRDVQAIAEAADLVRRLERESQRRPVLRAPGL